MSMAADAGMTDSDVIDAGTAVDDTGSGVDRVIALLNDDKADWSALSPQARRVAERQAEESRRVAESVGSAKSNPAWFVPLFCAFMVIGLAWTVTYYLTGGYPIPGIGNWNLAIGFGLVTTGFLMTMWWR